MREMKKKLHRDKTGRFVSIKKIDWLRFLFGVFVCLEITLIVAILAILGLVFFG